MNNAQRGTHPVQSVLNMGMTFGEQQRRRPAILIARLEEDKPNERPKRTAVGAHQLGRCASLSSAATLFLAATCKAHVATLSRPPRAAFTQALPLGVACILVRWIYKSQS